MEYFANNEGRSNKYGVFRQFSIFAIFVNFTTLVGNAKNAVFGIRANKV